MSISRNLLFATLLALSVPGLAATTAAAQTPPAAEAEQRPAEALSEQTQALIEQANSRVKRLADLKVQLEEAPKQFTEAQRELEQLKANPERDHAKRYADLGVAELERRLAERMDELANWQRELSAANSMFIAAQNRPERAQGEIGKAQARIIEINAVLSSGREAGRALTAERSAVLDAELQAQRALIELRRQELAGNSQLHDLGKARRDLMVERIARAEEETLALQALINDKRRADSEQAVAEQSRTAESAARDSLLAAESVLNLKLSDYLLRTTERLNQVTRQNLQTRQQLDSITQADRTLDEQITVLEGSQLLSRILFQQQQALPQLVLDQNLADQIGDLRLYQFELSQRREQTGDPQAYVERLLAGQPVETVAPELRQALLDLLRTRVELLDRLERELTALINESVTLQLGQKQLQDTAQALRETIDKQMFWIPSNRPLDWNWVKTAPERLGNQLSGVPWWGILTQLGAGLVERPLSFLPLLLVIALTLWQRDNFNARLQALSQDIGHFRKDSQLHTPLALLLNVLLAVPVALALALCGYLLQMDGRGQNVGLGAAFHEMARAWLVFYTAYRMLSPGRMAERHFRWSLPQVGFLRNEIRVLGMVVLGLVAVVAFASQQPASLADDVLGIVLLLCGYAMLAWRLIRLLINGPGSDNTPPLRMALGMLFSVLPLALMLVVGLGYYYSALILSGRLIDTLYLLMIWVALEATLVRSLGVASKRLAYQRMLASRPQPLQEGLDEFEAQPAGPGPDLEQVNQQALRLTRTALAGLFAVALYWVWADLISVFSYLENFTLYASGTGEDMTSISLRDLAGALVIVGITTLLARNLPGLLDMVLSRLRLAQGSAYATGTLLSYALVAIGIVSTLSTLGVSWDKLQWLVAALSVGLGFGLQEIFANFVSGLIILFERPVRIGDVVTIGNLSGTVSKIRIRATTITDFDHKEIIVPNKTFITSQLVNWSLNDTVTRVTLKVGVAYGSDLELVREVMLQAAAVNERVLKEPKPQVLFLSFGESRLDHELRIHVRTLSDRNPATDEINRFIDREFARYGIDIAFRQLDICIKNLDGKELHLSEEPRRRDDQPPGLAGPD
ncbi:mechanosensitive channel MscK [Stutzerimonas tarimensis]|uniref:Mechanosensitive channel MscK n=1 Tax=Stutzerimonas tarimensis TaxID=1507735 RepID=A0ABV7T3X1_9GAMM